MQNETYGAPVRPGSGPSAAALVIEPSRGLPSLDLRELWRYRELFYFLVWRDVKVRYAQTVLGAGWAVIQPVLTMVIFSIVFGGFAKMPSDGGPYPVFSLAALVPWTYFSRAVTGSSGSLVANTNLITKVYFPRLVTPLAPVLAGLLDLAIAFVILLAVMVGYGIWPHAEALLYVPLAIGIMAMTASGIGCWLAALNIHYRDVKYIVPFLVQIWMYASPVVYPLSLVPEKHRTIYALNPLVGVIESFRSSLLGTPRPDTYVLWMAAGVAAVLFVSGAIYFRWTEDAFADVA